MKRLLAPALMSILLSACGATGASFESMTGPADGKGKLYVYRDSSFVGGGVFYSVYANEMKIGVIRNGGYFDAELEPGKYDISGETEVKRGIELNVEPNKTYCIKAGVKIGVLAGRPSLIEVPADGCEKSLEGKQLSS